jgi:RHS repeat-associated protein
MEDRITESTSNNYIYFNGQVVAIHQQNDSFRLLFKDHLGSTRKVVTVPLWMSSWQYGWSCTESHDYEPFGGASSSGSPTRQMFQGKERNADLDYYGARYYDGRQIDSGSSMRWISPDSITSRIYDPPSLNKYTFVRNDPINMVDVDGHEACSIDGISVNCNLAYQLYYGGALTLPPPPIDPDWDPVVWLPGIYVSLFPEWGGGIYAPTPGESEDEPECFAQLKYRPVDYPRAGFFGFTHSFWWVQSFNGTGYQDYIISGGYDEKGYLHAWVSPGDDNLRGDSSSATTWWDSGLSAHNCDRVKAMIAAGNSFPNGIIPYHWWMLNSNSVARYIGAAGGFTSISPPPGALGWSLPIDIPGNGQGRLPVLLPYIPRQAVS